MDKRQKQNACLEKKLIKDITCKQEAEKKKFEEDRKMQYKANKERCKRELSQDDSTPKRERDATLQLVHFVDFRSKL